MEPAFPLRPLPDQAPPAVVVEQQQRVDELQAKIQKAAQEVAALKTLRAQFVQSGDQLQFHERDFQQILAQFEASEKRLDEDVDELDPAAGDVQAKFEQFSKEFQIAWQLFKQLQDADALSKLTAQLHQQQAKRADIAREVALMQAAVESDSEDVDNDEALVGTAEDHTHKLSQSASKAAQAVIGARNPASDDDA